MRTLKYAGGKGGLADARLRTRTRRAPAVLAAVGAGVCIVLLTPWASSSLAARSATSAHTTESCLDQGAATFPVKINVGTYRPPHPGPYGTAAQDPGPDNNNYDVDSFRYLVSLDNTGDPRAGDPAEHPGVHPMASNSPLLMEGTATGDTKTLQLPRNCRWLVTVQANVVEGPSTHHTSSSHKMWGTHVDLIDRESGSGYTPRDADRNGDVVKWVDEIPFPLPLAKLVVHVFPDHNPTNGAPDIPETAGVGAEQPGLEGFSVNIHDVSDGIVTQNFFGDPICARYEGEPGNSPIDPNFPGGECLTDDEGTVVIPHLAPGRYEIYAFAPEDDTSAWYGSVQTTTFEGDFKIDFGTATEKDDGTGAIREGLLAQLVQPTTYWFGFVQPRELAAGPAGAIRACAAHWVAYPPFDTPTINKHEAIQLGWVALSTVGSDEVVYAQPLGDDPDCPGGVIDIQNVPAGNYTMYVWDERLERIFRIINVSVSAAPVDDAGTPAVDESLGELPGDDGQGNIGVFRWTGWLGGMVFDDSGVARNGSQIPGGARNGVRDCLNPAQPLTCERGLQGQDLDIRFRDGSVKKATFTDANGNYEYPSEISKLFKFVIGEVGFGRFGTSGPCLYTESLSPGDPGWNHSQYNPLASCVPMESNLGGGLLTAQLTVEGHRTRVDWGKYPYDATETGQITGVVFYATTRNELDPRFAGAEGYEPGIPEVPVNLWWTGANQEWDGGAGDDVLVNRYADGAGTDLWEHPTEGNQGANGGCDVLDSSSNPVFPQPITHFGLPIAPFCLEFGLTSNETKDAGFDGGYAFADLCDPASGGWDDDYLDVDGNNVGCAERLPLLPGDYVVEVASAENEAYPGFPYKIVKEEDVNVDQGDPFIEPAVTPFPCVGPDHKVQDDRSPYDGQFRPLCTHREVSLPLGQSNPGADFFLFTDTPIPGRIFGLVSDDINVETDESSPWYGEPRALPNVAIGIRDYAYRLITTVKTDEYGFYEALLPSTQTAYCPTPAGTCPGTYIFVINDPEGEEAATGSVSVSGTTVTGTGTHFNSELDPGDRIRVGNEVRIVVDIADNNTLTVDDAWGSSNAGGALYRIFVNPNFNPNYLTEPLAFEVMPGKTTFLDTPLDPISGVTCSDYAGPEFFKVLEQNGDGDPVDPDSGVVIQRVLGATSELREVTVRGVGFGAQRTNPSFPSQPGVITLIHVTGGKYVVPPDHYLRWSDEEIVFRFPKTIGRTTLQAGPYQLLITAPPPASHPSKSLTAPTGLTLHYVQAPNYDPPLRFVDWRSGTDDPASGALGSPYRTIQYAIDREAAQNAGGPLIIVKPGIYRENPVLYVRAKLQGFGPGGINGTRLIGEVDPPEDENRRLNPGTVINASFFNYNPELHSTWQDRINGQPNNFYPGGPLPGPVKAPAAAGITVVGSSTTHLVRNNALRTTIDGFGIHSARVDAVFGTGGGGGIFVVGNGRMIWITNNFVEGNQGHTGGGIILGQPYLVADGNVVHNNNLSMRIAYNRILGNGGTRWAGGIAIYKGADNYLVDHNNICSNFSAEYGGGISHYGRSTKGTIADNFIYFNSAVDEGGGIMVAGRLPILKENFNGSGPVTVERNLISSNQSGDDGGGIKVLEAVRVTGNAANRNATPDQIVIVNNQLTNNVAADHGGAIALGDSPDVRILNNTLGENASTASCEGCLGGPPHAGGLSSEPHASWLMGAAPFKAGGLPEFSNPLLLNNLFYENSSYTFDPTVLPAPEGVNPLEFVEFRDFEVLGRPDLTFKPYYSTLSAPYDTGDPAANATNQVFAGFGGGQDPFSKFFWTQFDVGFNAATGQANVNILNPLGAEPQPPGHDGIPGDYHLCDPRLASPSVPSLVDTNLCTPFAIDQGADNLSATLFAGTVVPAATGCIRAPAVDYDGDARALDIAFFANPTLPAPCQATPATRIGIDIGADEMRNPGLPWIGPFE